MGKVWAGLRIAIKKKKNTKEPLRKRTQKNENGRREKREV